MKKIHNPIPFKISKSETHALLVQIDDAPYFYSQLHYHPEIQITAIVKGEGVFYAGNSTSIFAEKDVFIIGSNVPHLFKSSSIYFSSASPGVYGVSLFFDKFSFGDKFFLLKELNNIKTVLANSGRVIKIKGALREVIYQKILSSKSLKNENLIINFLEILSLVYQAEVEYLNSEQYSMKLSENEGSQLNEVLDYTFQYFNQEIKIEQIAKIACLSRSQFSHFFKLHTGKTYIQFLNELRIENACILLTNSNHTIEQICYEVGFQNVSNFVRHFKKVKQTTPSNYRKSWIDR